MKGPPADSGDNQKSVPGNPECLLPPLPSDSRNNLDLRPSPFHPSAPTPYSSPAQQKAVVAQQAAAAPRAQAMLVVLRHVLGAWPEPTHKGMPPRGARSLVWR